ncbi:hypothetical protein V8F33_013667 [Rhypophila sp. PSN 637]
MSWMDSWSRPGKHQATPAPFYLLSNGEDIPYCRSCGRVISSRKSAAHNASENNRERPTQSQQEVKYCSSRCRTNKPGSKLDRRIEEAFQGFLCGEETGPVAEGRHAGITLPTVTKSAKKGDARIIVPCDVIEEHVFGEERRARGGDDDDKDKTFGRKKNRASRVIPAQPETQKDVPKEAKTGLFDDIKLDITDGPLPESSSADPDVLARLSIRSGTRIRPAQTVSQVNGSVGGEKGWAERITETDEMKEKRVEGQRRSHEKEMVRSAARRGVVFGFVVREEDGQEVRRRCEAVMQGKVVEPSFAKGGWGIRWRE